MTYREALALSAARLNDQSRATFTDDVLVPYLNMTLLELQEIYEENNVPITNEDIYPITIPANTSFIDFNSVPALPQDLVEIQEIFESEEGQDNFFPMTKKDFLPPIPSTDLSYFGVWVWVSQKVKFFPLVASRDIRINYIKSIFPVLTEPTLNLRITAINSSTFIFNRTAGLAATDIGENETRAAICNGDAVSGLDRSLQISAKARQSIVYRRRPFRSGYKLRGSIY